LACKIRHAYIPRKTYLLLDGEVFMAEYILVGLIYGAVYYDVTAPLPSAGQGCIHAGGSSCSGFLDISGLSGSTKNY
jgi:hypothetical protein